VTEILQLISQLHEVSITWSLFDRCGGVVLRDMNGGNINSLQNVLTASLDAHDQFGGLDIRWRRCRLLSFGASLNYILINLSVG
jgi:hypothetical protein